MSYTQKQIEKFANFYKYKLVNELKTPYSTTSEVLSMVTAENRYEGQEFKVFNTGGDVTTWQFRGGILDSDLYIIPYTTTQNITTMSNFFQTIL